MLLKNHLLFALSAAVCCSLPLSAVANQVSSSGANASSEMAAWYQARQQQLNAQRGDLSSLLTQANAGDANAQYDLAMAYQSGHGAPQDLSQAQRWFESSAQSNNAYAQYALALLLRDQGGQADVQRSVGLQEKAALAGHPEALYGLGMLYANGQFVSRDLRRARHWLGQAYERGNAVAGLALRELPAASAAVASQLQSQPAPRPVAVAQKPVIASNLPQQQVRAAVTAPTVAALPAGNAGKRGPASRNNNGGHNQSAVLSARQLEAAASKGDRYAQLMLGAMYEDGTGGVKQSHETALRWYLQSARQGYPKAQHNLALLYEDGKGTRQDHKQAAAWYEKAAQAGFTESQNNLAVLYLLGKGVQKNRARAEQLLRNAVQKGNANAKRNLNLLLQEAG